MSWDWTGEAGRIDQSVALEKRMGGPERNVEPSKAESWCRLRSNNVISVENENDIFVGAGNSLAYASCCESLFSMDTSTIIINAQHATDASVTRLDIISRIKPPSPPGLCLGGYTVVGAAAESHILYTQSSSQFGLGPGGLGPPACLATMIWSTARTVLAASVASLIAQLLVTMRSRMPAS